MTATAARAESLREVLVYLLVQTHVGALHFEQPLAQLRRNVVAVDWPHHSRHELGVKSEAERPLEVKERLTHALVHTNEDV